MIGIAMPSRNMANNDYCYYTFPTCRLMNGDYRSGGIFVRHCKSTL